MQTGGEFESGSQKNCHSLTQRGRFRLISHVQGIIDDHAESRSIDAIERVKDDSRNIHSIRDLTKSEKTSFRHKFLPFLSISRHLFTMGPSKWLISLCSFIDNSTLSL
jgi:hypothetical protein